MPGKKFKEPNTKSLAAKERKDAVKRDQDEKKRIQLEDEYWRDDDKHVGRKQDRKAEKEKKRQDQLDKKIEARKLLEKEEASLKGKTSSKEPKITRAQIAQTSGATPLTTPTSKDIVIQDDDITENPNILQKERELQGHYTADTIDDAIHILHDTTTTGIDKHPEKRMKAAFNAFEERELPRIKSENPTLRLSQIKQLLNKEWSKSPDNPMNQPFTFYKT